MYFVTNRWLGGTLTNFRTIKQGLERLRTLERMREDGTYEQLPKKETRQAREGARPPREVHRRPQGHGHAAAGACSSWTRRRSRSPSAEARKLHIPIVAITDTNCDPDLIDYVIPGNDDAIRSVRLITGAVADACIYGAARAASTAGRVRATRGGSGRGAPGADAVIYQAPRDRPA